MSPTIYTVTTKGLKEATALLRRYPEIAQGEMVTSMSRAVTYVASSIKPFTPVDQGRLVGAIGGRVEVGGGTVGLIGGVPAVMGIVDAGGVEYALPVEVGRKPGTWPPVAPLIRWAHLHGMDESAGYAIAAAIFKRGLPAHAMFAQGWLKAKGWVDAEFARMLGRITRRLGNG